MKQMSHQVRSYSSKLAAVLYMAAFFLIYSTILYHMSVGGSDATTRTHFDDREVVAKSVYVYDTETGRMIYGRNEHLPLPLASITKLMTAICALDHLDQDSTIVISPSDLSSYGDTNLVPGDIWRAKDLVSYMLIRSSNDAAINLAKAVGGRDKMLSCMNAKAEDLSLLETRFYNETGLDITDNGGRPRAGAYGSAEDAATLLHYAMSKYPEIFGVTRYQSYNVGVLHGAELVATNTNKVQGEIIGIEASKTGLTDLAGGNLVFEMNAGLSHRIVIAILGSTEDGRFDDARRLSRASIDYLGNFKSSK